MIKKKNNLIEYNFNSYKKYEDILCLIFRVTREPKTLKQPARSSYGLLIHFFNNHQCKLSLNTEKVSTPHNNWRSASRIQSTGGIFIIQK